MLHHTQDATCTAAVRFWNSEAGVDAFFKLVGTHVHPPPPRTDAEALSTLRAAVPPILVASAAEVDVRVQHAAQDVAHRLRMARESVRRFHDHLCDPAPPRHGVYAGAADRPEEDVASELHVPMPTNPYFARWVQQAHPPPS